MMPMETRRSSSAPAGMSRGLRIALIATIVLTVLSFGVRKWRQARTDVAVTAESVEVTANTRNGETANTGSSNSSSAPPPANAQEGLRGEAPPVSLNPMARRNAPPPASPPVEAAKETPPPAPTPPPEPQLAPPGFRLIGVHRDGKQRTVFFALADKVITARPGAELPDGFVLKSIKKDGVTVIRRSNKEKIEMPLEMPK